MNKKILAGMAVGIPLLLLGFQNCSEFQLTDEVVFDQSLTDLAMSLDNKLLPGLLQSSDIVYWNPDGLGDSIKKNPILAKEMGYVIAIGRNAAGKIISVDSGSMSEEGSILVQNGKIRATRYTSSTSYNYLEVNVPSVGDKMVLAASFGEKAGSFTLMVNGVIQTGTVTKVGTPLDFSYLAKGVSLAGTAGVVDEVMVYGKSLNNAELNVLSRYVASNNGIKNVIVDPALLSDSSVIGDTGSGGNSNEPTAAFLAAKSVIDARCVSCHGAGSSYGDFSNLTEARAKQLSLVIPGSPESSKIYYRLAGSSGSNGPKNMPSGSTISTSDVKIISDWISGIK